LKENKFIFQLIKKKTTLKNQFNIWNNDESGDKTDTFILQFNLIFDASLKFTKNFLFYKNLNKYTRTINHYYTDRKSEETYC
jgi:hypothetical protein